MKKMVYSPDAVEDIRQLKKCLSLQFGTAEARKQVKKVQDGIKALRDYSDIGISTKNRWDIDSEYMVFYIHHNYVFYKIRDNMIFIVDILDEREDVLWRMFRAGSNSG